MQKIYCDKCGCELTANTCFDIAVGGTPSESFDLCGDCREELIDWLAGCQAVAAFCRTAEACPAPSAEADGKAEDPLYGGDRNDRTGYSLEELMSIADKSFYEVTAWLERNDVTALDWRKPGGVRCYRFFLSPDQLEKLRK